MRRITDTTDRETPPAVEETTRNAVACEAGEQELEEANKCYALMEDAFGSTLEYARQVGDWLNKAKERVGEGEWTEWLKEKHSNGKLSFEIRMAQNYMFIANNWDKVKDKKASIRKTLEALAGKKKDGQRNRTKVPKFVREYPRNILQPVARRRTPMAGRSTPHGGHCPRLSQDPQCGFQRN
ncbi:MAG: hypothetical protein AB9869_05460 [Verrucomicrobiia bacterium]